MLKTHPILMRILPLVEIPLVFTIVFLRAVPEINQRGERMPKPGETR